MGEMASQITSLPIVYSTIYSCADQGKHQSTASLVFIPVNSPHKWPGTQKMFPFDDVNMIGFGVHAGGLAPNGSDTLNSLILTFGK